MKYVARSSLLNGLFESNISHKRIVIHMIIRFIQSHKSFLICNISKLQFCSVYLTSACNYFYTEVTIFPLILNHDLSVPILEHVSFLFKIMFLFMFYVSCSIVFLDILDFLIFFSAILPCLYYVCIYLNGWICIFNGTLRARSISFPWYSDSWSQGLSLVAQFRTCRKGGAVTGTITWGATWEIEERNRSQSFE